MAAFASCPSVFSTESGLKRELLFTLLGFGAKGLSKYGTFDRASTKNEEQPTIAFKNPAMESAGGQPCGLKFSHECFQRLIIYIIRTSQAEKHLFPMPMTSYKELLKQREALEQQISEARHRELSDAVAQVQKLVTEYGLTAQDVFPSGKGSGKAGRSSTAGSKVAPKYRDPATGQTWTGRGKAPKWIQNEDRTKFAI